MGSKRLVVAVAAAAIVLMAGCESATVDRVNSARAEASRPALATSTVATEAARAHSAAMCASGSATPSADPAEEYDQETAASVTELVGSAPLDPAITDWGQRNGAAANQIWTGWQGDSTLVDPTWDDIGVGEYECPDGNLYSTMVLRDAPSMPTTGRYSSPQYTAAQVQTVSALQYGTAVDYQGNAVALLLDLYLPPTPGTARPLVILVHGGGFVNGSRADFASTAREYARRGYVAASIDYRLDPRAANDPNIQLQAAVNGIDDGIESVRWLRANAATYSIDVGRIAGLGSSAGGVITLGMAMADDPTPGGPLAGVSREVSAAVSTGVSLSSGIGLGLVTFEATDAPVMMFHYETDTVTGDSDEFAFETCSGLRDAGSTCDFRVQPGSGHTVSLASTSANWANHIGPFLWHHLDL